MVHRGGSLRAFVTGVTGFVGAHLAARLVDDGWAVTGTVRPGSVPSRPAWPERRGRPAWPERRGRPAWPERHGRPAWPDEVELVEADLADPYQTAAVARRVGADVAFLLAAARAGATAAERAATLAVNASSVRWVLDGLAPDCRTVVRLGSSTEYAAVDGPMDEATPVHPRGFFGVTKAAGSRLLAGSGAGRRTAILRAFQVYGPFDHAGRLVPTALRAALTGETLRLTAPGRRRDWVYVDDVVEACVRTALADHLPSGQVLNIGTGRQAANEEVVAAIEDMTGRPIAVARGAHPGREWDTGSWVCDPSLARELLGWEAEVALDVGLRRCWEAEIAA